MTDLRGLPAIYLRELAALAEQQTHNPWHQLQPEALEEGLAMLSDGIAPGFGWWRRHLPLTAPPPYFATPVQPRRDWEPWELVVTAIGMAEDRVKEAVAVDVLAQLAGEHHLDAQAFADAVVGYRTELPRFAPCNQTTDV